MEKKHDSLHTVRDLTSFKSGFLYNLYASRLFLVEYTRESNTVEKFPGSITVKKFSSVEHARNIDVLGQDSGNTIFGRVGRNIYCKYHCIGTARQYS